MVRPDGGIGRRNGLKIRCPIRTCGFDPRSGYHFLGVLRHILRLAVVIHSVEYKKYTLSRRSFAKPDPSLLPRQNARCATHYRPKIRGFYFCSPERVFGRVALRYSGSAPLMRLVAHATGAIIFNYLQLFIQLKIRCSVQTG